MITQIKGPTFLFTFFTLHFLPFTLFISLHFPKFYHCQFSTVKLWLRLKFFGATFNIEPEQTWLFTQSLLLASDKKLRQLESVWRLNHFCPVCCCCYQRLVSLTYKVKGCAARSAMYHSKENFNRIIIRLQFSLCCTQARRHFNIAEVQSLENRQQPFDTEGVEPISQRE